MGPWWPLSPSTQSICLQVETRQASLVAQMVKNLPARAEDMGYIPGSGISLGGGHGNPLQYSYLDNPINRGAW